MLNKREQRKLDDIEHQLASDDPDFVRRFTSSPVPTSNRPKWGVLHSLALLFSGTWGPIQPPPQTRNGPEH